MPPADPHKLATEVMAAIDASLKEGRDFDLSIQDLELKIYLRGPRWDGVVDRATAKFLLDLDQKLRDQLDKRGFPITSEDHGLVALRIKDGSLDATLEYAPQIIELLKAIDTPSKIVICLTILLAMGIFKGSDLAAKRIELEKERERTKRSKSRDDQMAQVVDRMAVLVENTSKIQQPLRNLLSTMGEDDVIQFPGSPMLVSSEEAKAKLGKATRNRSIVTTYYVDHPYIIEELSTKKPGEWQVSLRYGSDTVFKAQLLVRSREVGELLRDFEEAHERNLSIAPDLQVVAEISGKGNIKAQVVGLGKPRKGSIRLSEALEDAKVKSETEKQLRASERKKKK